jgi:hypothetical protein
MSLISSWGHINGGVSINKYRRDFERIASKYDARCRSKGLGNSIVRFVVTHIVVARKNWAYKRLDKGALSHSEATMAEKLCVLRIYELTK